MFLFYATIHGVHEAAERPHNVAEFIELLGRLRKKAECIWMRGTGTGREDKEKGYTVADIKAALDAMEFRFSEKAISGVMNESNGKKKRQPRKAEPAQVKSTPQDEQPAS